MRRRSFLGGLSTAATASVAGCLGAVGGGGSGGSNADVLQLDTIEVAGSPGTMLPVRKPGTVTLLDFWATWCAPCKPQMKELRAIDDSFPDIHMLSITNEDDEMAVKDFWQEYDGTWPVAMDTDLKTNDKYDVTRVPTLIILDEEGTETWRHVGLAAEDTIADKLTAAGE